MEKYKTPIYASAASLSTILAVILAARQIGISQIFIAISSTLVTAVVVSVGAYSWYKEREKHKDHDRHDGPSGL